MTTWNAGVKRPRGLIKTSQGSKSALKGEKLDLIRDSEISEIDQYHYWIIGTVFLPCFGGVVMWTATSYLWCHNLV
jgi:hypothetical protein